ncbi:MAG TPA: hypothetical protein PKD77_12730 [Rudaea sp.]|jgi:hypothetical protein|nr:hypothetical protein [Rudaea sp.]
MNLQALLIRASVSLAAGLAMAAGIALNHAKPAEAFTAKPTLSVKPHTVSVAEPVTLPTIHVRPTLAQRMAAAQPSVPSGTGMFIHAVFEVDAGVPTNKPSASARLDMPYYSFGKVLPRIGAKE